MVSIIPPGKRDRSTAQTMGMLREAAIARATGAEGLWMGWVSNAPGAASGAHHHGQSESGIYILKGTLRFRWGERLEHVADAEAGDFIFVPPFEVHSEENLDRTNAAEFIVARNTPEGIVVNVEVAAGDAPD